MFPLPCPKSRLRSERPTSVCSESSEHNRCSENLEVKLLESLAPKSLSSGNGNSRSFVIGSQASHLNPAEGWEEPSTSLWPLFIQIKRAAAGQSVFSRELCEEGGGPIKASNSNLDQVRMG